MKITITSQPGSVSIKCPPTLDLEPEDVTKLAQALNLASSKAEMGERYKQTLSLAVQPAEDDAGDTA